jgi:hypothetical protein
MKRDAAILQFDNATGRVLWSRVCKLSHTAYENAYPTRLHSSTPYQMHLLPSGWLMWLEESTLIPGLYGINLWDMVENGVDSVTAPSTYVYEKFHKITADGSWTHPGHPYAPFAYCSTTNRIWGWSWMQPATGGNSRIMPMPYALPRAI